jgi:RNA polymerase sigma-70 factor (ECF subfamily)
MTARSIGFRQVSEHGAAADRFEQLYREQVDAVTGYFARRASDPQTVADLTADTFVAAIRGFASYDPRRGTARAWVFGIARNVFAAHCADHAAQQGRVARLAGWRELGPDHFEELVARIDAEQVGRRLLSELVALPELDRAVVELVDLVGLRAKEAASVLGLSAGAVRMRLMRSRARLRHTIQESTTQER